MNRLLLASTVLAGLTVTASAADLPRRMAAPPVYNPIPVFTWTGFYLGANAGYGFNTARDRASTTIGVQDSTGLFQSGGVPAVATNGVISFANRNKSDGFVGGAQVGYNYQFTPGSGFVVGVEADAQYTGFGRSRNDVVATGGTLGNTVTRGGVVPGTLLFNPNGQSSLDYFGTVRGRLGYAFDRTLVYATGGFAYGGGGGSDFGLPNSTKNDFQTGYAVGGGVEYALPVDSFLNVFRSSAVTFKLEGLYVNMAQSGRTSGAFAQNTAGRIVSIGDADVNFGGGPNGRANTEFVVARAGINYKFGSY